MKAPTVLKTPRLGGIAILNIIILAVLAFVVSNKVSQDHKAEVDSAVRASNRLVRAVVSKRDLAKDQRLVSYGLTLPEMRLEYAHSTVACTGRFE